MKKLLSVFLFTFLPLFIFAQRYCVQLQSGNFLPKAQAVNKVKHSAHELVNGRYYRFIQFKNIPTEEQKRVLTSKGLKLYNYIPNNTFMVSIPASLQLSSVDDGNIRSIFSISAKNKLSKELAVKKYPEWALRGNGKIELTLMHHPDLNSTEVADWLRKEGIDVINTIESLQSHRVIVRISDIQKIAALPYIYFLEPVDNDPKPDNLVGRSDHRSNMIATDYSTGLKYDGTGVSVALNDDGVIGPHIDYQGRIIAQYTTNNSGNHGDHCAGTIFGSGNRNPTARGMAFGAQLGVYRVSSTYPSGYQAFDSIYNHYNSKSIRITSTSYSDGNNTGYTTRARLMDVQIRNMPELMHVFSSGNAGTSNFGYGAGAGWGNITGGHKQAKNVMTTGNLTYQDALAGSSSRGPAYDGRIKPDICAVGTDVNSTINPNTYELKTGTSMACPGISGTLAQLYHAYKSLNGGNNPPSALIKAVVLNTADDLGNPGPDYKFGWGRINAGRAYKVLLANQFLNDSLSQGGNKTHTIVVPTGVSELRVMVYWPDYEATAGAAKALVNNLNMNVVTPTAQTVLPWILNSAPNATTLNANAVQGIDSLNNVEQVTIPNPAAGNYTVAVNGYAVPQGPQKYFLVYEFVTNEITLVYPSGGESLVPGTQETIRWDAYGNSGTFTLQYSTNNGGSWTNIATNISASQRYYNWTPPATVTGQGLVKVTRGTVSDQSDDMFSVIGVPGSLTVDWVCTDSMKVSYSAVTGATGYIVTVLGNTYMDSAAYSTTTSCVVSNINTSVIGWFSVQAISNNNCKGRRALAQQRAVAPVNCNIITNDLAATNHFSPSLITFLSCSADPLTEPVSFEFQNNGTTPLSNISLSYSVDGNTPVTENFAGPLNVGATAIHNFTQPIIFTTAGIHTIKAWVQHASNIAYGNDTVSWQKTISYPTVYNQPFFENFETFTQCDTTANCETETCVLSNSWFNDVNGVEDDIDWRVNSGPTPSNMLTGTTGPVIDNCPANVNGKYLYLEADACGGKMANLVSPCLDLTGIPKPSISFAYHMFGSGMGELHVDVFENGAWSADIIPPFSGNQGDTWKLQSVDLSSFSGIINIRFRGITGSTFESDIALDCFQLIKGTGIQEMQNELSASIFPNPSEGVFDVQLTHLTAPVSIQVYNANGSVIMEQSVIPSSGKANTIIKLEHCASGIYWISIQGKDGVLNKKLIRI